MTKRLAEHEKLPPKYRSMEERIIGNTYIDPDVQHDGSPCWIWYGKTCGSTGGRKQYARVNVVIDGRHTTLPAHRVAYEAFIGPIPEGHQIDHLCCNTMCVAPLHLEAVTGSENCQRRNDRSK